MSEMTLDQLAEQARKRVHDEVFGGVSWITDARWNLTEGIIREALEAVTQAQREQEVELHRELSDALAMVDAQREQLEQAQAACFEWDVLHKEQRRAADEMRRLAVRLEDQLTAIERALPGWASDTSDVPVVDLVRSCVKTFEQQLMQVMAALKELRINANRLCDRNQGGTYEEDCRRSIAHADAVLSRAFQAEHVSHD